MTLLGWLLALSAVQGDAEEIARQAARLTPKDHRQSFAAVSALAELAAGSRAGVEAAAAKIPDDLGFYREALQEELRLRAAMGGRLPALKRRSFDFKEQTPLAAFTQATSQFTEKIDFTNFQRRNAGAPFSLELKDVSFTEAIDAIGRAAKAGIWLNGTNLSTAPQWGAVATFAYRNFIVLLPQANRSRVIEFGAGEKRSLNVWFQVHSDSDGGLLRVGKPRIVEAVDGDGRAIAELPPEKPEAVQELKPAGEAKPAVAIMQVGSWQQQQVSFALPKSESLGRLRGWFDASITSESSSFEIPDVSKSLKLSDDHFGVECTRTIEDSTVTLTVRVTPKAGLEAFAKMPVEFRGTWGNGYETPFFLQAKSAEGRVDFSWNYTRNAEVPQAQELKSLRLRVHRAPIERRIPFEFRDLDFK